MITFSKLFYTTICKINFCRLGFLAANINSKKNQTFFRSYFPSVKKVFKSKLLYKNFALQTSYFCIESGSSIDIRNELQKALHNTLSSQPPLCNHIQSHSCCVNIFCITQSKASMQMCAKRIQTMVTSTRSCWNILNCAPRNIVSLR